MHNLPLQRQYLTGPLLVLFISGLLQGFEPASSELFKYSREMVTGGEIWRLISGNFVHTNFAHFVLNSLGLMFIWVLHAEHYSATRYLVILLAGCVATGLGIHFFGSLDNYAGLSGTLHGVIAYGALKDIKTGLKFGWPLLIGILIKVGYENLIGSSDSVQELINASVAVDAHLYGLCAGLLLGLPIIVSYIKEGPEKLQVEAEQEKND